MVESIQHKLDRVRPPRVQITYDVEIGDAIIMKELPFVMGIMADLSGHPENPLPKIKHRKFIEIDRDNFDHVMLSIQPRLAVRVPNKLDATEEHISAILTFSQISDFDPLSVVNQIEPLQKLYNARVRLKDLMTKLDGNDPLDDLLLDLIKHQDKRDVLQKELALDTVSADTTPSLEVLMTDGKLARDDTQRVYAKELMVEFLQELIAQGASAPNDSVAFITQRMQYLDDLMTTQLNEFMHAPEFQKLEGSWRGLRYLVMNTETSVHLKLRLMNITKQEILDDLEKAIEFDQSTLFKKIYEEEYGTFGGHPYSCMVGDYEFTRHPMDLELLQKLAQLMAPAHVPFLTAAHPKLFDIDTFEHLGVPRDLSKIFESLELIKWNGLRDMEDSRYINMVLPHTLIRLPYGANTVPAEGINFEEDVTGADSSKFCWTNTAYILAERITNAFAHYGWTAAIRGVEGGGIVEGLPSYTFKTTDGDIALKCPTQVAITDRREKELSDLGFIALCHCKGTDYAAFFGGQTVQRPKVYNTAEANANAALSARLPYILAASRFAHYIKVIMRDKIGSFMTKDNVAKYLNNWIANYVLLNDDASQNIKASYPLREGRIDVFDIPGKPGSYTAVAYLRPHFQLEELSVSIRLVATLPPPAK